MWLRLDSKQCLQGLKIGKKNFKTRNQDTSISNISAASTVGLYECGKFFVAKTLAKVGQLSVTEHRVFKRIPVFRIRIHLNPDPDPVF